MVPFRTALSIETSSGMGPCRSADRDALGGRRVRTRCGQSSAVGAVSQSYPRVGWIGRPD